MTNPPAVASYEVARLGNTVYVRAVGLANMRNAPMLDAFLAAELKQQANTACVDLSACSGMDSTFMGLLVGHAKNYETAGGKFVIVNPTAGNLRMLRMLGVVAVIPVVQTQQLPQLQFVSIPSNPGQSPEQRIALVQRAHQNLVQLNEANREKFAAFLNALAVDLQRLKGT